MSSMKEQPFREISSFAVDSPYPTHNKILEKSCTRLPKMECERGDKKDKRKERRSKLANKVSDPSRTVGCLISFHFRTPVDSDCLVWLPRQRCTIRSPSRFERPLGHHHLPGHFCFFFFLLLYQFGVLS